MAIQGQLKQGSVSQPRVNPEKRGMEERQGVSEDTAYLENSRVWPHAEASKGPWAAAEGHS